MKRIFSLILVIMMVFGLFTGVSTPAFAADGGEGSLHITSHSDGDTIDGSEDIKIKWSKVPGADHYWITIKDEDTGAKPINQAVDGRNFTVEANSVFVDDGHTYKVYVAAMNKTGAVLNGASEWHAIRVVASVSDGPDLVYASPALIEPQVSIQYLPDRGCYYGYGGEISSEEDLKIKFENVYAPAYSITVAVLTGTPDYGSSNEGKLTLLEMKKHQSSRRYTVDQTDLATYAGHFLKVVIQPLDEDTGDYGLMSQFYFFITEGDEPTPAPSPEPNPEPAGDRIIVGGIDTGYADGDFFTKNGQACSCHNKQICLNDDPRCNCIQHIEYKGQTVDLMAVQCFGWSRYIQLLAFSEHDGDSDHFQKIYTNRAATASGLKDALQSCSPGTHIRTSNSKKGYAHSVTILYATSSGVTITDCNHTDRCQVSVRSYSYSELADFLNAYGPVDYISVYKDQSDDGGKVDITLGDESHITGAPGQELELDLVLNTPLAFLQGTVVSDLDYTIKASLSMTLSEGSNGLMFYNALAQNVSGKIATIRVQIPEDAKVGDAFTFEFKVTDAFSAEDVQFDNVSLKVQIEIQEHVLLGDINGDTLVDARDMLAMIRYLLGDGEIDTKSADLDDSGHVNAIDLLRLIGIMLS